jgi:hypothetical protein
MPDEVEPDALTRGNGTSLAADGVDRSNDAFAPFLEYLQTEKGHQLASRAFDLLEGLKKATLDEQAKSKAQQAELAKLELKHTVLIQTIGLVGVVGAIIGLSAAGALAGEAATILGAVAGYLFAQRKRSEA